MTPGGNRMMDKLNTLLDERLDNFSLSPDAICQHLGLSRAQLHRLVKQETRLSITLYIRQKKLKKAQSLLLETDLRISEIAYLVGIESPQNFSKYFTAEFQISPTDFRKQAETQKQTDLTLAAAASIAVLPFVNMSNDPAQEYFSDGISEEIINVLSHVPRLNVAGRTSSFTFKGNNQDLRLIGEQLNVEHVLEGSVRRSGDRLRITAQLIKVEDGYHLWSEKYDRELKDIFDIQDEIALAILKAIKVQLLGEEQGSPLKRYTPNSEAYQLYLHGRYYHNKFAGINEFTQAIDYYQAAIALEPTYAIAYAGIASCYLNLWFYRHLPSAHCLPLMKQATQQALQLDNTIAESHLAMARMQLLYEWDFITAADSFKKAVELNWNAAELHSQYALYWSILGNHVQAIEQAALALSLEPFSLINTYYAGYVYWAAGDFDRAVAQGKRLVALEPTFWGGHSIVGLNLITLHRYDEARRELETALNLNYNGMTLSACGVLYALSGEEAKARDILIRMLALHQTQPVAHYDLGIVHACLGELDMACGYFETAIEKHEPPMLFFRYIVRDWITTFVQDKRYHALIGRLHS